MENSSRGRNPQLAGRVRTTVLCAALVLAGAVAVMHAVVQRVELAWKLEAGTDLVYRESQQVETELPQGMGTATMRSGSTERWSVLEVDGSGNTTVRMTTEQVHTRWPGDGHQDGHDDDRGTHRRRELAFVSAGQPRAYLNRNAAPKYRSVST